MSKILGARFGIITIAGLMILTAFVLTLIGKGIISLVPNQSPATAKQVEDIMVAGFARSDSLSAIRQKRHEDSLRRYQMNQAHLDSLQFQWYKNQTIRDEKYRITYSRPADELFKFWADRYDKK